MVILEAQEVWNGCKLQQTMEDAYRQGNEQNTTMSKCKNQYQCYGKVGKK